VPRDLTEDILQLGGDRFYELTGYSHGGPVYAVDHIVPPALVGANTPANMCKGRYETGRIRPI